MQRFFCILCLFLHASCLTPMLWSGSLITEPVTKLVATRHCQVDSVKAGFYLGEPVLVLEYHWLGKDSDRRVVLLVSNQPPSEKTSPFFLALKPDIKETLNPSDVGLRLTTHRFKGSTAPPESMAKLGLRGKASLGPAVVQMKSVDVPLPLRKLSARRVSEQYEARVQTLVDRFSNQFQLPGRPDVDDRGSWTALAWVGPKGEVLEDRAVALAMSEIQGLTREKSEVYLLGRRFSSLQGDFVYVAVSLEYQMLLRELNWTGAEGNDQWTVLEGFRVLQMSKDFALEKGTSQVLPHPDLDFFESEYEITMGSVSDSLVTKILLTPVTLLLDAVGVAVWVFFKADSSGDSKPDSKSDEWNWNPIR